MITKEYVASIIDHTILKAETTPDDIKKICNEAKENSFASVCVNPCYVKLVADELKGSNVKVCTVIGFPLGATTKEVKAYETEKAIEDGANEVDMVINIGMLKAGNYDYVKEDIKAVVDAAKGKALVKVIIETCLLTDDEKIMACKLAKEAGADFVKTSTGFSKWGAKAEDVKLMRDTVGPEMGVKASGGVHSFEDAVKMIEAGANRIGASSSLKIIGKSKDEQSY
ncbi:MULTISPECIES: deoxyribose-phosphate aldolase [Caloramator]|jgi:deoxyribose-phosphate aldolase|uniref:Deoxyribose-phosphate aldolase n=1 Tax=Caloramator australicus RC3 TaxID=857293 RepID=I7LGL8_9CLOT|nr:MULTISPECIES: deoxyribose-phosphate aldolase [Caloramator]MDO6354418.1 deoxyribose-phosphate aldolase [Caloramator sp. CAR-1]CCJ33350.1 Deoxyribose-phosphate aldolase [Caloramator australicus RC3]